MNKIKARCPLDELKVIISNCYSWAQVMRELEKLHYFSERSELQQRVKEAQINIDHFTGQSWNKGNIDLNKFNSDTTPNIHVDYLLKVKAYRCEKCGLTEWQGEKIPLEVHHIDGNRRNNDLSNLQLLCPNCHSLTDNFRGKGLNNEKVNSVSEEEFVEALQKSKNIRRALITLGLTPKGGNYSRAYELAVKYNIQHILEH